MDVIFSIYRITNLSNERKYIGLTQQTPPRKRWDQHKSPKGPQQKAKPLHRAILKHGKVNFKFEILCQTKNLDHAKELEKYFIKISNSLANGGWGYNLTDGGDGGIWGYKFSDEQKKQMSESAKKRWTPEERKKYSEMQKGKIQSPESNRKRSEKLKGISTRGSGWSMSIEHKQAISDAMMHHKKSDAFKEKTRARMSKQWSLTSPEGIIHRITNLTKFCREHNLSTQNLWKVSKGIISQSQGWKCKSL